MPGQRSGRSGRDMSPANEFCGTAADPVAYPRLGHREHLIEAAYYWTKVADQWEDVSPEMRKPIPLHRVGRRRYGDGCDSEPALDLQIVSGIAEHTLSEWACSVKALETIGAAQRRVIYAVQDAQRGLSIVEEDLSVTDTRTSRTFRLKCVAAQSNVTGRGYPPTRDTPPSESNTKWPPNSHRYRTLNTVGFHELPTHRRYRHRCPTTESPSKCGLDRS